jgi:hypothetical protein
MPSRIVIIRNGPLTANMKVQIAVGLALLVLAAVVIVVFLFSLFSLMAAFALGVFLLLGLFALVSRLAAHLRKQQPETRTESFKRVHGG